MHYSIEEFFINKQSETDIKVLHNDLMLKIMGHVNRKNREVVSDKEVDEVLKDTCLEIEKRYEVKYFEVGTDNDRVHFQAKVVLTYSAKKIIQTAKSILARRYVQEQKKSTKR